MKLRCEQDNRWWQISPRRSSAAWPLYTLVILFLTISFIYSVGNPLFTQLQCKYLWSHQPSSMKIWCKLVELRVMKHRNTDTGKVVTVLHQTLYRRRNNRDYQVYPNNTVRMHGLPQSVIQCYSKLIKLSSRLSLVRHPYLCLVKWLQKPTKGNSRPPSI